MVKFTAGIAIALFVFCINSMEAQEFNGQATYESKTQIDNNFQISSPNMTEEMKNIMKEKMKKAFEKTYVLNFNRFESLYFQEEKMQAPQPNSGSNFMVMNSTDGKKYKNIKEKQVVSEEDIFGKEFLIVDSLPKWEWKMEQETKKIGNYTCSKAIINIPVTAEERAEYDAFQKNKKESATQFMMMGEPKDKLITAWYTTEIPVSQGPDKYWGLPGLILEVNDGSTILLCSKIILNPKEKAIIKRPTKGKKVTKKEYEAITEKQLEKMKDDKGNIRIQIGG